MNHEYHEYHEYHYEVTTKYKVRNNSRMHLIPTVITHANPIGET